ncbi:MAG: hypothetical protein JWN41_111 [Thermoleophilia bacterium]|nr:hypothetical protein [Thermoleophilia bacterium]
MHTVPTSIDRIMARERTPVIHMLTMNVFPRAHANAHTHTRIRTRSTLLSLLIATAVLAATVTPLALSSDTRAATATPNATMPTLPISRGANDGARWSAIGANIPYLHACDFGCGAEGVRAHPVEVDRLLRTMSERGVRVVRWYLFRGGAEQIERTQDGTPTGIDPNALRDLDYAARIAEKYDVYLVPVVLPSPADLPVTWFTDPVQVAALATTLAPLFHHYRGNGHVYAWELTTASEHLVDEGRVTGAQLRAALEPLVSAVHATTSQLALAGPTSVDRIDTFAGLGFDAYDPQATATSGAACALCRSVASLVTSEGVDAPVFIGGFTAASDAQASLRLHRFAQLGYAGALAWAWRGTPHPDAPTAHTKMPDAATWKWHYTHTTSGPRARPLNPCLGPIAKAYRCPNLTMSRPSDLSLGRRGGRLVLFSANSLNSVGTGAASLHGTRDGRYTMAATQLLRRANGSIAVIRTGARLQFKAVPHQYRYWKWNGAARMELWRIDSVGTPIELVRTGPKTVYCLRDLEHTRPWLARSPGETFPGCNRSLATRVVTLGASVGWSDVYPSTYNENWIDVQGLRGCFAYVHIADPTNVMYESNEHDNTSRVTVKLPFTGSSKGCPGAKPLPVAPGNGGIY